MNAEDESLYAGVVSVWGPNVAARALTDVQAVSPDASGQELLPSHHKLFLSGSPAGVRALLSLPDCPWGGPLGVADASGKIPGSREGHDG